MDDINKSISIFQEAITLENNGQKEQALNKYLVGINMLQQAIPNVTDPQVLSQCNSALVMYKQQAENLKQQILFQTQQNQQFQQFQSNSSSSGNAYNASSNFQNSCTAPSYQQNSESYSTYRMNGSPKPRAPRQPAPQPLRRSQQSNENNTYIMPSSNNDKKKPLPPPPKKPLIDLDHLDEDYENNDDNFKYFHVSENKDVNGQIDEIVKQAYDSVEEENKMNAAQASQQRSNPPTRQDVEVKDEDVDSEVDRMYRELEREAGGNLTQEQRDELYERALNESLKNHQLSERDKKYINGYIAQGKRAEHRIKNEIDKFDANARKNDEMGSALGQLL